MRARVPLIAAAFVMAVTPSASAGVIGPTPKAAALAATEKYARHEVQAWNRPGASYTLETCRMLHRRPWLAWGCEWELHGTPPPECLLRLIVAVTRLSGGGS